MNYIMTPSNLSPDNNNPMKSDVVILGGGLAGLTLALQIRQQRPETSITVLERRRHPVPVSAHKVGESTVEIGAHYLADVIGLRDHLEQCHLRKYGLRLFFDADKSEDLAGAGELGGSGLLSQRSFQIDRGVLENHLAERVDREGISLIGGATVRDISLADDANADHQNHRVVYRNDDGEHDIQARWVVDAMSRGSILKRRLGLAEDNHHACSSVWFRLSSRIDISDWSQDEAWHERCRDVPRWLSTNHLMGPGYWVWLIPLASGSTSVGVVFDNRLHDFDRLKTYAGTLDWLAEHQPLCRRAIDQAGGELQDFLYLRNYSHGCRQVFSGKRWALTGEAGVFLDPFYSPGSDFIGISNTYIADLVQRDLSGESIARRARVYQHHFFSFYESSLLLYRDQYPLFGHARAMSSKTIWDYVYYWGVLALLFFSNRLTDTDFIHRHVVMLDQLRRLNGEMQTLFRRWAEVEPPIDPRGLFVNQTHMPLLVKLNEDLGQVVDDSLDQLDARLVDNGEMLRRVAGELCLMAPEGARDVVTLHQQPNPEDEPLLAGLPARFVKPVTVAQPTAPVAQAG
ncbi:MAG: halogenase [Wenzhouxiangella sp.]|nr:MAG: halogenase [Wenzhouxiangella sp.]